MQNIGFWQGRTCSDKTRSFCEPDNQQPYIQNIVVFPLWKSQVEKIVQEIV